MVNRLVELGIDPEEKSNDGCTALHLAALSGHVAIANRLVKLGVDPEEKSNDGRTALHLAALNGHVAMVNRLFNLGAVDVPDCFGFTALHMAIHRYKADIVRTLVNAGGDFHSLDPYGYSPLEWAARTPEIYHDMQVLLQKVESPAETIRRAKRKSSIAKAITQFRRFPELGSAPVLSTLGRLLLFDGDDSNACFAFMRNAQLENGCIRHSAYCNLCGPETEILGTRYTCRRCPEVDLCSSCMKTYGTGPLVPGCRDHEFLSIPQAEMDNYLTNVNFVGESSLDEWLEQLWTAY